MAKSLNSKTTTDKALEAARRLREVDKDVQTDMVSGEAMTDVDMKDINAMFHKDHVIGPEENYIVDYDSNRVSGEVNFYKKEVDTLRSQVNQLEVDKSVLEEKLRAVSRGDVELGWDLVVNLVNLAYSLCCDWDGGECFGYFLLTIIDSLFL